uniref:Uncharacterized protein n=1 Tax=Anguilla anguilla TaxID=7936 RepID=A0A0E9RLW1_ANGAN
MSVNAAFLLLLFDNWRHLDPETRGNITVAPFKQMVIN